MNLQKKKKDEPYNGFEQGAIRPPSEAYSLLIRATRNCPWGRCAFCPVYKGLPFSVRPVEHVKKDIDLVSGYVQLIEKMADESGHVTRAEVMAETDKMNSGELQAFSAAFNWLAGGMKSIFIQDANSLVIKPSNLVKILLYLKKCFPQAERITSYARSHTVARIKDDDLKAISEAGLNRIHIGLESGFDEVLKMVKKGVTKADHIKAGLKVKKAGMELSEYVMPGLGGRKYSKVHALETADALNQINPDFIRLRPLVLTEGIELAREYREGRFDKCTDLMMAEELLLLIENLDDDLTSVIKSDHILNLFEDLGGAVNEEKEKMLTILRTFLSMEPERRCMYQVGRRRGIFSGLGDMENSMRMSKVERICKEHGITPENVDGFLDAMMNMFV